MITAHISTECMKSISNVSEIRVSSHRINVSTSHAPAGCSLASGTWLVYSDWVHGSDNFYEDFAQAWYPMYLMSHGICGMQSTRFTHICGNRKGYMPFSAVYSAFGQNVPWQTLHSKGATHQPTVKGCITFGSAVFADIGGWAWLNHPVPAKQNNALIEFGRTISTSLGVHDVRVSKCRARATISLRTRGYRDITNMLEVEIMVRATLVGFDVGIVDFTPLTIADQIKLLKQTDIYIFSHGGAGPLVMFLPKGAVAIELFPWGFADPMYRNMAVMTGTIYLAWQNVQEMHVFGPHGKKPPDFADRNTNTYVNCTTFQPIVQAAMHVVSANIAERFMYSNMVQFNRTLCGWCSRYERTGSCGVPFQRDSV